MIFIKEVGNYQECLHISLNIRATNRILILKKINSVPNTGLNLHSPTKTACCSRVPSCLDSSGAVSGPQAPLCLTGTRLAGPAGREDSKTQLGSSYFSSSPGRLHFLTLLNKLYGFPGFAWNFPIM